MGSFDSVKARCPECGRMLDYQSKAGDCTLTEYNLNAVPAEIAASLDGSAINCGCGAVVTLRKSVEIAKVPMHVMTSGPDDGDEP